MTSLLVFTIAFIILLVILVRRFELTKKDIKLQEILLREEENKEEMEESKSMNKAEQENLEEGQYIPKNGAVHTRITRLWQEVEKKINKGDQHEAKTLLIQIISLDDKHVEANKKLGCIYLMNNDDAKAEFVFRKALEVSPDPALLANLALALYKQKKMREAAEYYEKALEVDDTRAARFANLAQVYEEMGDRKKAYKNFQKAHFLDPKNIEYLLILVNFLKEEDDKLKVRELLDKILDIDPYNQEAKNLLAEWGI